MPAALLAGCGGPGQAPDVIVVDTPGAVSIRGEVWADNWFAFYLGERLIVEDSTPITTERSFNAEAFVFNADYPLQLNVVAKGFKQDDTGLEYIGRSNQQMGDGGLIAQFTDVATGATVAVTNTDWRCLLIHDAPLDRALRGRVRAGARRRPVPVRGYAGAGRLAPARIRRCRMAVRGRAQRSRRQTARRL